MTLDQRKSSTPRGITLGCSICTNQPQESQPEVGYMLETLVYKQLVQLEPIKVFIVVKVALSVERYLILECKFVALALRIEKGYVVCNQ